MNFTEKLFPLYSIYEYMYVNTQYMYDLLMYSS